MRLKALCLALASLMLVTVSVATPAAAQIEINVNKGDVQPLPIAIPAFGGTRGADIAQVITGNLERSGLFAPIGQQAYIEKGLNVAVQPRFPDWKAINAQALVNGQVTVEGGRLRVDFRLWDIYSEQQLLGLQFTSTPENWRRVAHKISDAVYERLTGEKGYFDTRIVFVSETGGRINRTKTLAIMDQDGANPSYLTDGSYIVMSPRFSPDGGRVAFSVERGGNSDIYVMNLKSRSSARLTSDPGIDTSASFSPDGTKIVFNSDRGGQPQLYIMNSDGSGVRRISYGSGRYTTPVWSPVGDFIAFTKQTGGEFHIGVMRPDGSDERLLTTSYLDESPTWAPNGRVLMFSRETPGGPPRLWTVDVTGRILRPAPYPGSGSDPAWSPLLN